MGQQRVGQMPGEAEPQPAGSPLGWARGQRGGWGGGAGAGTRLERGGMCSRGAARAKGNHPNNSSKTMSAPAQEKHSGRKAASRKWEAAASGREEVGAEGHLGQADRAE